jgi:hypothetical protein
MPTEQILILVLAVSGRFSPKLGPEIPPDGPASKYDAACIENQPADAVQSYFVTIFWARPQKLKYKMPA